jgi:hypothetical protein
MIPTSDVEQGCIDDFWVNNDSVFVNIYELKTN